MAPQRIFTECLDHEAVVDVLLWLRNHRVPEDEVDVLMRHVFRTVQRLLPRRDPALPLRPWIKAITDRHCLRSARRRRVLRLGLSAIDPGRSASTPALD